MVKVLNSKASGFGGGGVASVVVMTRGSSAGRSIEFRTEMRISEGFGKPENDGKVGYDIPSRTPPLALSKYYEVVGTTL